MIAQCTSCGQTFETETWGVQTCPSCGTRVMLDPPAEENAPEAEASAPVEVPPPFEDPNLGFFAGYFQTVGKTMFHPTEIFSKMPVGDAGRALLYGWITQVVAGEIAAVWAFLRYRMQAQQLANLPQGMPPVITHMMADMRWYYRGPVFVLVPIVAILGIFIGAGIIHLGAMVFGAANRGWNATFRAVCYAAGPGLLAVIPVCGAAAGGIWVLVLEIIALMHTQKTSGGRATAAVLVPALVLACCLFAVIGVGVATGVASMQSAMHAH